MAQPIKPRKKPGPKPKRRPKRDPFIDDTKLNIHSIRVDLECVPLSLTLTKRQVIPMIKAILSGRKRPRDYVKKYGMTVEAITVFVKKYENAVAKKAGLPLPYEYLQINSKRQNQRKREAKAPQWFE